ncbi:MAG: hypothetical protein GXO60_10075 [Epsilonproteobacteria bacterium]|nr:hypothetical protein [Campylobacterota bacterium]
MKNILLIALLTISIYARIDFSKHLNPQKEDITLSVTHINRNDVLNLRLEPSLKSKVIYHIPYDAKNLTTYDKDILEKVGKNIWVPIRISFIDGYIDGWVKGKYIKIYEKYSAINTDDLLVIYPSFLTANITKDGWIELLETIEFEHYSGCDTRANPKLLDELNRFNLKLKVYNSLRDVFVDENFYNYKDVTKRGWFKHNNNHFVKHVNLFGVKGYKKTIGAEGCGIVTYFFKINGKIVVIKEPFDNNPPIIKDNKKLPNNLKIKDRKEIIRYIIENIRVF